MERMDYNFKCYYQCEIHSELKDVVFFSFVTSIISTFGDISVDMVEDGFLVCGGYILGVSILFNGY